MITYLGTTVDRTLTLGSILRYGPP